MGLNETLKVLADPTRREILHLLKDGPLSAGDLAAAFEMTAASVSYHLKLLKKAGLIVEAREKNFIYYSLNTTVFEEVLTWIAGFRKEEAHEKE